MYIMYFLNFTLPVMYELVKYLNVFLINLMYTVTQGCSLTQLTVFKFFNVKIKEKTNNYVIRD